MIFIKIIFYFGVMVTSQTPYDTHPEEVINRAKFDISTSSSFGGVKTDRHTDRIALYVLDEYRVFRRQPKQ